MPLPCVAHSFPCHLTDLIFPLIPPLTHFCDVRQRGKNSKQHLRVWHTHRGVTDKAFPLASFLSRGIAWLLCPPGTHGFKTLPFHATLCILSSAYRKCTVSCIMQYPFHATDNFNRRTCYFGAHYYITRLDKQLKSARVDGHVMGKIILTAPVCFVAHFPFGVYHCF